MATSISSDTTIQTARRNVKIHKTVASKKQANIKTNFVVRLWGITAQNLAYTTVGKHSYWEVVSHPALCLNTCL